MSKSVFSILDNITVNNIGVPEQQKFNQRHIVIRCIN